MHTYTVFYKREDNYREMKQNGRSKHKDINDMLDYTIQTIQHTRKEQGSMTYIKSTYIKFGFEG